MNTLKILFFFFAIKICSFYQFEQRFGSRNTDFYECMSKASNQCFEVKFTSKYFQCCKNIINKSSKCNIMLSPIKSAQDELKTENGKILTKELMGFSMFNAEKQDNLSSDFECSDGKLNFKYYLSDFTEEEKVKFKSQKHCLKINAEYTEAITKDICYKADLATAGNSGASCGFYEFDIIFGDKSKIKHQTCFLFNDDIRTTKNLGYSIKQMAEMEAVKVAGQQQKELSSYQMIGTNSKEKSFKNYSVNDTVSIPIDPVPTDTDTSDTSDTSDSTLPSISKFINCRYIFLLILFLF